jgi:hypothetical protein
MLLPGKFRPRPSSKVENGVIGYGSSELFPLAFLALLAPGLLLEYAIFRGYEGPGIVGLLLWVPVLWCVLIKLHDWGRVRFWLSASTVVIAHTLTTIVLARS